jgi:hypothetical protein
MSITVKTVKMTDGTMRLKVVTPYLPELPPRFRALGGKWSAEQRAWYIDPRDDARLRAMLAEFFGQSAELVDVRVNIDRLAGGQGEIYGLGRQLCRRPGRDYNVRLGDGVILIAGDFPSSGGSRNNPRLNPDNVTLEIRDVPRDLAERFKLAHLDCEILSHSPSEPDPIRKFKTEIQAPTGNEVS